MSQALIGVELEATTDVPVTWPQLDSLAELLVLLSVQYGWRWPFVLYGHYAVALPVGRRSDPYLLEWGALMGRLYARAKTAGVPGL